MYVILSCILIGIFLPCLGCAIVWHRYSYVTDGIIHVMLLAALLNLITQIPFILCGLFVSIIFLILNHLLQKQTDDYGLIINVITTSIIALGLILAKILHIEVDIESLLFGEILSVELKDVLILAALSLAIVSLMYKNFDKIVLSALNYETTKEGYKLRLGILFFTFLSICVLIQIIGSLMISSLAITPVFFAKVISRNPKTMVLNSIYFSSLTVILGICLSLNFELPSAASITVIQFICLFLTFTFKKYII